jgi:hypothetical protein
MDDVSEEGRWGISSVQQFERRREMEPLTTLKRHLGYGS